MKKYLFALLLSLPAAALAESTGKEGFAAVKQCVMQNDTELCNRATTGDSHDLLQRFMSYRLMPCLPTNFSYVNETPQNGYSVVKASMPASGGKAHHFRMAFTGEPGNVKLDIPRSLQLGFGEKWEDKINMAEQIFLMLQANAGGNIKCDQLTGLIKK